RPTELRARSTRKGGEATSRGAMQTRTEVCAAWDAAEWDREERDRWQTGAGPEGEGGVGFEEPGCGRVRGRAAARDARAPPEAPPPRGNRVVKRRGWKERRGRRKEGPRELESRRARGRAGPRAELTGRARGW